MSPTRSDPPVLGVTTRVAVVVDAARVGGCVARQPPPIAGVVGAVGTKDKASLDVGLAAALSAEADWVGRRGDHGVVGTDNHEGKALGGSNTHNPA